MNQNPEVTTQIAPLIDEAVARLGEKDRDALVLRFFENKTFAQVAAATGTSEDAAKKRVTRALERLRAMFVARQLPLAAVSLASFLSSETVKAAPSDLGTKLAGNGGAAAASSSAWIIAKETMRAMFWMKVQFAASVATLFVLAATTAGVALYSADELALNTPKRALRSLAKSFSEGDGRKFVNGLYLTLNESPILAEPWKATLEHLVVAQGKLRKALVDRFGAVAVSNAVPMWHTLDDAVLKLTKADERVEGAQAKFPITAFGQTFPNVPLMLKTNNQWKLPVDLRFKGGQPVAGDQTYSLRTSFQGKGLHLSLSAKTEFDAEKAKMKFDSWADTLNQVASNVRAGKLASAEEAWEQCAKELEKFQE